MENLAPPLEVILELEHSIHAGRSLQGALNEIAKTHKSEFRKQLEELLQAHLKGDDYVFVGASLYRKTLIYLLERGLRGHSILDQLQGLREEVEWAVAKEFDSFIAKLPFISMIPLLGFFFPAYLLVLVGPIIAEFLEVLRG